MKRIYPLFIFLIFVFEVVAELKDITILHTNDFHGHIKEEANYPGAAKISAYFKLIRQSHDDVLILDAGDSYISNMPESQQRRILGYDWECPTFLNNYCRSQAGS